MSSRVPAMSVVAGVDGSEASLLAVRWGAGAAVRYGLPLHLVHVIPHMPPHMYAIDDEYIEALRAISLEDGEHFLADAKAAATGNARELEVTTDQVVGEPVEMLGRASASARIVAVGATGRSGLDELLAGSTALELPGRSHAPVVIVRPAADGTLPSGGPVVVGIAGSLLDHPPVEFAFEQASILGADLVAVHSWSDSPLPDRDRITGKRNSWNAIFDRENRLLAEALAGYSERYPDVPVRSEVVFDRPARALLMHGGGAQLLVVGTRGRGVLTGTVLGSTSRAVIKLAECPVAVVRQHN